MKVENYYLKPKSLEEAFQMANDNQGTFRYIAGGTDLIPNIYQKNCNASCLIDLQEIEELKKINRFENYLSVGAGLSLENFETNQDITQSYPVLAEAAASVATPVIRKTATLGGNLLCDNRCIYYNQSKWWRESVGNCLKCNGNICIATGSKRHCYSEFVSDTAVALIALNAQLLVFNEQGEQLLKLEDIYSGEGVNHLLLKRTTIIKSILIPLDQKYKAVYNKLRLRSSLDFTSLTTTVSFNQNDQIRVVLGGVDPKPVLVLGDSKSSIENMIQEALKKSRAIDNEILSRKYRRTMIQVFLMRSFQKLKSMDKY
ncbi:MAG: FAD binding domain-containing protein [Saprospiraceae bacterium]|nr:FAD binding domain-containing protein [Saprospiraceae bacterium]